MDLPRVLAGAIAFAIALGAYARWRISAGQAAWIAVPVGALMGTAITATWGLRPTLAAALVILGMVVESRGRWGVPARVLGLAAAYALTPVVGLCGLVLLAWGPSVGILHWVGLALGLGGVSLLRWRAGDAVGPLTVAEIVLALSAGALASRPLGRWVISAGPRLASYVVLLILPALAVLGFAWGVGDLLFAPDDVGRALVFGLLVALAGAGLALAGIGLLTITSSSEPTKPELAGLFAVPPLIALAEGWPALGLVLAPLGVALAVGILFVATQLRNAAVPVKAM
jgi:hypothetical protein